jgi:hypothetical protein
LVLALKRFGAAPPDRRVLSCATGISGGHACPTELIDSGCAARANAH